MSTILGQWPHYPTECQDREIILTQSNGADNSKWSYLNGYLPVETKMAFLLGRLILLDIVVVQVIQAPHSD